MMAPAVPEERNTGRQLVTCSPRHDCDRSVWHCVSLRRPEFRPLFITAGKTSRGATGGKQQGGLKRALEEIDLASGSVQKANLLDFRPRFNT